MLDAKMMERIPHGSVFTTIKSPVGVLTLVASDLGLHALLWDGDRKVFGKRLARLTESPRHPVLARAKRQLEQYFEGRRQQFDLPLDPRGTPFQQKVWKSLRCIPYGVTVTYAELAHQVGDRKKARAVGMANSRNPVAIFVPCHRVVGKKGALVGFAGGLDAKKRLLELELN